MPQNASKCLKTYDITELRNFLHFRFAFFRGEILIFSWKGLFCKAFFGSKGEPPPGARHYSLPPVSGVKETELVLSVCLGLWNLYMLCTTSMVQNCVLHHLSAVCTTKPCDVRTSSDVRARCHAIMWCHKMTSIGRKDAQSPTWEVCESWGVFIVKNNIRNWFNHAVVKWLKVCRTVFWKFLWFNLSTIFLNLCPGEDFL